MREETPILNDRRKPAAASKPAAEPVTCTIEKWVYGGEGLARISADQEPSHRTATDSERESEPKSRSHVVLAPFVLPGETVRVRPGPKVHAELLEVLTPSADRIEPYCPLFTDCGGCHYQHAPYEFQLARKVEILQEQLQRVGKIEFDGEIGILSGEPFGYRNRAQFHIDFSEGKGRIGYRAARSHRLVPVDADCPVSSPGLNAALAKMREKLDEPEFPRFLQALEIFTNETDVQINVLESDRKIARRFYDWCESVVALDYETRHGMFRVSPKAFFQVNRFLVEPLVEAVVADHRGGSALDLYAGVGLFAVPLGRRFEKVMAVESSRAAALDLEGNAIRAQVPVNMKTARAEQYLAELTKTPDLIVADPPRAGLGQGVVADLQRLGPAKLVIVSCDPATLARDLATLVSGDTPYKIDSMTMVDLFPQTFHMETVVHLSRV